MELKLQLELSNVFGGDGVTRIEKIEEVKLKRSTTRSRTKSDVGVTVDSESGETVKEMVDKDVHTFERPNGNPTLRLGGVHGKLWGTMKDAGFTLAELGRVFKSKAAAARIMKMVNVYPMDVELTDRENECMKKLPQMLAGFGNTMIQQHFDVIGKCNAEVTVEFPDEIKEQIIALLEQIQKISCLNKRRGSIKIANWDDIAN